MVPINCAWFVLKYASNFTLCASLFLKDMNKSLGDGNEAIPLHFELFPENGARWIVLICAELCFQSRVRDSRYVTKKLKWSYAEYIARKVEGRWEKKDWNWSPGKERGEWLDLSQDDWTKSNSIMVPFWGREANVRNSLRKVGVAYVQQWAH